MRNTFLGIAVMVAVFVAGAEANPNSLPHQNVHLSLKDVKGKEFAIPGTGPHPAVLVFVTPACPLANQYAPILHDLAAAYAGRADFYRVYSADESAADVDAHEAAYHFGFTGLLDPEQHAASTCGATRTPEAVVLDAAGAVRYRGAVDDRYVELGKYRQSASREYLRDALDAVLANRPVATECTNAVGCFIPSPDKK